MADEANEDVGQMSFEQALDALEKIVDDLERDRDLDLRQPRRAVREQCAGGARALHRLSTGREQIRIAKSRSCTDDES